MNTVGGYFECCKGFSVTWGIHDKYGGYLEYFGGMLNTTGDLLSAMGGFLEYGGGFSVLWGHHDAHGGYHEYCGGYSVP